MKDYSFTKDDSKDDKHYIETVLRDGKLNVEVVWNFDEQQADPFHQNYTSDEFMRRLRRYFKTNLKL